jgi:hypothetical protein
MRVNTETRDEALQATAYRLFRVMVDHDRLFGQQAVALAERLYEEDVAANRARRDTDRRYTQKGTD